ncbi:hypothetical protein HZB58_01490 [Candidatus Gottesmanbacteria bacterium]|nr:hypothetical protein [Candidatus Gottesmanbacteria bacterium]
MPDATYQKFVKRWEEVTDIPPQTLGPLTQLYKQMTKRLKVTPLPWFVGVSLLVAAGLYIIFGPAVSAIVTLLQRGF